MSLFRYFKKAQGNANNNSENVGETSEDNEGNSTGTAEQQLPEENSKKRLLILFIDILSLTI
jgi:hypothetical protein